MHVEAQKLRPHAHIAVGNHKQIMLGLRSHDRERVASRIWPRRIAGKQKPHGDIRMLGRNFARYLDPRIRFLACAEQNLEFRIFQREETLEVLAQSRLCPM
jgi:hypothetical protein